ncbi:MAG: hypothetical protein ACJ79E_11585 [Anaeromyxobacteraceae bacterium]
MPIAPATAALRAATAPSPRPPCASFGDALRARGGAPAPIAGGGAPASPGQTARAGLEAVERARERLDGALAAARRGQTFTAQELLALQADAYRYTQTLEIASKAVEGAAQGVKQAINTQV